MTRKSKKSRIDAHSLRGLSGHPPKDKSLCCGPKGPATAPKVWENAMSRQSLRFIPKTI